MSAVSAGLRLIAWTPQRNETLRGLACVQLPSGQRLCALPVHVEDGTAWAVLTPSPALDSAGCPLRNSDGAAMWAPVPEWRTAAERQAFSERLARLVAAEHPEDMRR